MEESTPSMGTDYCSGFSRLLHFSFREYTPDAFSLENDMEREFSCVQVIAEISREASFDLSKKLVSGRQVLLPYVPQVKPSLFIPSASAFAA